MITVVTIQSHSTTSSNASSNCHILFTLPLFPINHPAHIVKLRMRLPSQVTRQNIIWNNIFSHEVIPSKSGLGVYWARAVTRLVPGPVSPATARAGHCGGRGLGGSKGGRGFLGVLSNLSTVFTQRAAWDRHRVGVYSFNFKSLYTSGWFLQVKCEDK